MGRAPLLAALLVTLSAAPAARAENEADRTTARALAREGQAAFDRGDFKTAADRFARADALVHAPTLLLALARSQERLGQLVRAYESYSRIVREGVPAGASDVFKKAVADATQARAPLEARLAWVTLVVSGASGARVLLDGEVVSEASLGVRRAVDPGTHRVQVEGEAVEPSSQEFKVAEGASTDVALVVVARETPAAAPPRAGGPVAPVDSSAGAPADAVPPGPRSGHTVAYVALGVGGLGLLVGSITGVMALGRHSDLEDQCPGGRCPESSQGTLDSFHTLGTVSTIGFVVGAVGLGTGVSLLFWSGGSSAQRSEGASMSLGVAPSGLAAWGRF